MQNMRIRAGILIFLAVVFAVLIYFGASVKQSAEGGNRASSAQVAAAESERTPVFTPAEETGTASITEPATSWPDRTAVISRFAGPSFAKYGSVRQPEDLFNQAHQREFLNRLHGSLRAQAVKLKARAYIPETLETLSDGEFYLTFTSTPDSGARALLADRGIELLEHITRTTWRVIVSDTVNTSEIAGLTGAEPVWPADKCSPRLWEQCVESADADTAEWSVMVSFAGEESAKTAQALLQQAGAVSQSLDDQDGHFLVRATTETLLNLCSLPPVSSLALPPPPEKTHNANAAALSNVDDLQTSPYGLTGSGIRIAVRDGGQIASHSDFGSRLVIVDTATVSAHATHVAGTIGGSGAGSSAARGMATAATLYSYDYSGDNETELQSAFNNYGIRLSNHSYGHVIGWDDGVWNGDSLFGDYSSYAQDVDELVYGGSYYVFKSAGNDRNDSGTPTGSEPDHDGTLYSGDYYDCIGDVGCAKNIITVGAVEDDADMTTFSSFGPADDGRIKPDIVANGYSLYSPVSSTSYGYYSGTSMSSPTACGAAALVIEKYRSLNQNNWPSTALLKGLLIHTAEDLGRAGPDYSYGWGLLDAKEAVDLLETDDAAYTRIVENSLEEGQTNRYELSLTAETTDLRVTVYWTDPNGSTSAADALVNDLDLKLISPDGSTTYYPYILPFAVSGASPANTAVTGTNQWDNVEQVEVGTAATGNWILEVSGTVIPSGPQSYVLLVNNGNIGEPVMQVAPANLSMAAEASSFDTAQLVISNRGESELYFNITDNLTSDGYTWNTNASHEWIDITPTGTELSLSDDGVSSMLNIGFDFPFYDGTYSQFMIGANGVVGFASHQVPYTNVELPTGTIADQSLAVFWDDLNPAASGAEIWYESSAERLVIYYNVPKWGSGFYNTFQVVLYPTGRIVYRYNELPGNTLECTVGIQDNSSGDFIQIAHNTDYLRNGLSIEMNPPGAGWLSCSPQEGSVAAGTSQVVTVTASSTNLTTGVYSAQLIVSGNDPQNSSNSIPVEFSVLADDQDADGLPDSWEYQYFGNGTNAIPSADPDGDDYTNEEEYIAGLNPTNADSFIIGSLDVNGVLGWNAVSGRVYNVYWSSNLLSPFSLLYSNYTGGTFTDGAHSANDEGFYRINVELAP